MERKSEFKKNYETPTVFLPNSRLSSLNDSLLLNSSSILQINFYVKNQPILKTIDIIKKMKK
jgi:hypothetical protein